MLKMVFSALLALVIGILNPVGGTAPAPEPRDCCPIVFVHGLGGWGEGALFDKVMPHWGMFAGSMQKMLNDLGYETHAASVGPISSAWDRACELYAHITGTTVDYGEAHAKAHDHSRYGQTYKTALVADWSTAHPIALVGHSFGGATSRLLAQLCEQGDAAEQAAGQENISPLFTGELRGSVCAVVSLAAPHNGSTASEPYLNGGEGDVAGLSGTMTQIARIGMVMPLMEAFYPFRLGHYGADSKAFYKNPLAAWEAIDSFAAGTDNAAHDLTLDGAAKVNAGIDCQEGIYYFSFAALASAPDENGNYLPKDFISPMFVTASTAMGQKREPFYTAGGILVDDEWLPNDGLVNLISAKNPFGEPVKDYDANAVEPGIWQLMPLLTNYDHMDFGGGMQNAGGVEGIKEFYVALAQMIADLP